jgi:caffeoyl-CoA O-methyltransferase
MPNITYEPIEKYLYDLLPPSEPAVLREMEAQAKQRDIPIVGPAVARLLSLLARISGAKRIFEAGSAIGYSTIWWALAVGDSGRVTYTDGNPKNAEEAKGYFQKAGVAKRIDVRVGDALEILSEEKPASLDIIFNDVDKEDYPRVFKLAVPRLKPGVSSLPITCCGAEGWLGLAPTIGPKPSRSSTACFTARRTCSQ